MRKVVGIKQEQKLQVQVGRKEAKKESERENRESEKNVSIQ